ncbi:MAG: hypothetical protein QM619_14000 [Micropruina sp.]|uniref:hypothetical protein n=1 Tax=Micropruina sp. TaxID=2737536 RepID=UPI0039E6780D
MTLDEWVTKLVTAACTGKLLDLADGEDADPANADQWPDDRRVPADAIRTALLTPDLKPDPRGLRLWGADVTGALDLDYATLPCQLTLTHCRFNEPILMQGASLQALTLSGSHVRSLDLDGAHITGSVFLDQGFNATGQVRANGAHIEGLLGMRGATLTNPNGDALSLDGAHITTDVFLDQGFNATGQVRAIGAQIGGQLNMRGATLTNPGSNALTLDGAHITGSVILDAGFTATGQIHATGAHIGRWLNMRGASLTNPGSSALTLDGAQITGNIVLDHGFTANGTVSTIGTRIAGKLTMSGAAITNPGKIALDLEDAHIAGSVSLDLGFTVTGAIRAVGAQIGGGLDMGAATVVSPGKIALDLETAHITGHILLNQNFTASGEVCALGIQIEGGLDFRGGTFSRLVLDFASIQLLALNPKPAGRLSAVGWKLGEIDGALNQPHIAIEWLDTAPDDRFAVQPWHELAAVYERRGRPADAKLLRFQAAHRVTRHAPGWSKPVRWLYGAFAGYGYYPLLAGLWLILAAVVSGAATYFYGPTPIQPGFDPWLYGAAVVIPPAAAITPSTWTVTEPLWLAWVNIALKAFGWLQTGILLAGLTGLLKKS